MASDINEHAHHNESQIDFFALLGELWREKLIISVCVLLAAGAAIVYSVVAAEKYESSAVLAPPRASDVASLNLGRAQADLSLITASDVYDIFVRSLLAGATRRVFFDEVYRPYQLEHHPSLTRADMLAQMRNDLTVAAADPASDREQHSVTMRAPDPELASQWVKRYIELAEASASVDLQANIEQELSNSRVALEQRVAILRTSAKNERADRIARLREALAVADSVGIDDPQVTTGDTAASAERGDVINGNLLYKRGSKAIRAELDMLASRETDDPFIADLRDVEQEIQLLGVVTASAENVNLYRIDTEADVPDDPVWPNRPVVVALGIMIGLIFGLAAALARIARRRSRGHDVNR